MTTYLDAVATGDAAAAHEANPWSPSLTAEAAAASAAGEHLTIVKIGQFEGAGERLKAEKPDAPEPSAEPSTKPADDGWWGIDWDDDGWGGLRPDKDEIDREAEDDPVNGFVPVTVKLGEVEVTIPLGVSYARDRDGQPIYAFRTVELTEEQQARFGVEQAGPALPPVAVTLELAKVELEGDETESCPWWKRDCGGNGTVGADLARAATVAGVEVLLDSRQPLVVLPGSYPIVVLPPATDEFFASPGTPEPVTAALLPGASHAVALAPEEVTEAGRAKVTEALNAWAKSAFEDMTNPPASDREVVCGPLKPGSYGGGSALESDGWLHTGNSNIARGAIKLEAESDNGATATGSGNGSGNALADLAWCPGRATADGPQDQPVVITDPLLTAGVVAVEPDGSFTTTQPWKFSFASEVVTVGNRDATDTWAPDSTTTIRSQVALEWSPAGRLGRDGQLTITPEKER
ncbi:MAG: hypothetical protein QM628_15590 [Propionicimonas sp.]